MKRDPNEIRKRYALKYGYDVGSVEELRVMLVLTAQDIADGYEFMLPYFLRLEEEIARHKQREADLRRARDLVRKMKVRAAQLKPGRRSVD